jgi:peptidoglycan hydrolase CwlO-like protein
MKRSILSAAKFLGIFFLFAFSAQQSFSQNLSDKDIKKNVAPIESPLKALVSLEPKAFEYKTSDYSYLKLPKGEHYGFIAEEVQEVFPALVTSESHSYMQGKNRFKRATTKSVDLEGLIPILVASIKEQQAEIDQLKKEIESLKGKIK